MLSQKTGSALISPTPDARSDGAVDAPGGAASPASGRDRWLVPLLFTASGAAGLVYEVTWSRILATFLGSTVHAVSVILAVFMVGFALGGLLAAKLPKRRSPWRAYACAQAGLALIGLAFPLVLGVLERSGVAALAGDASRYAFAVFAVAVPTVLMGATFPWVVAAYVRDPERVGRGTGWLGGANLFGAAMGALLAGFVTIRIFGIRESSWIAAGLNALVFASSWLVRPRGVAGGGSEEAVESSTAARESVAWGAAPNLTILVFYAGFATLALQVAWTRVLTFFLEGFTFTFATLVATHLVALFLGSVTSGSMARDRERSRRVLRVVSLAWPVASVAALAVLLQAPDIPETLRFRFSHESGSFGHALGLFASACLYVFVPTFLLGMVLPAAAGALGRSTARPDALVGRLYAIQNFGAALGAIACGFVLLDVAGMKGTIVFVGAAGFVVAAGAARASIRRSAAGLAATAVAGGLLIFAIVAARPAEPVIESSHVFRGSRGPEHVLVTSREGSGGSVSVVDNLRTGERFLYTDDFLAAGTGERYHYMRLLGHVPSLFCAQRESALVIGFGSGTTAAALAKHPFAMIDIVEILPEVLEVAPEFDAVHAEVLDDPRARLTVGDGRHFLQTTSRRFDVITLEPLMPYTPGAVSLYTAEFYELGRERLAEDGVFCQWIPVHGMRTDHFRRLVSSFQVAFPTCAMFAYETSVIVLGTRAPQWSLALGEFERRAGEEAVAEDLVTAGFPSPRSLFGAFVSETETIASWLDGIPPMRDNRPVLEFYPLPRSTVTSFGSDNLVSLLDARVSPVALFDSGAVPSDAAESLRAWARAAEQVLIGTASSLRGEYLAIVGAREDAAAHLAAAESSMARALTEREGCVVARRWLRDHRYRQFVARGRAELRGERPEQARVLFERACALRPERHLAHYELGRAQLALGAVVAADESFAAAIERFDRHADSWWHRALIAARQGRAADAASLVERARSFGTKPPFGPATVNEIERVVL